MPDPILMLEALVAAALVAAATLIACAWPWRSPGVGRMTAGSVIGTAAGFLLGCWLLGGAPHWPPREDRDRLLLILLPAVAAVELAACLIGRWAWLFRLTIAAVAARILLHGTVYLEDPTGAGTLTWTSTQAGGILAGLAIALASVWAASTWLARRRPAPLPTGPGRSLILVLIIACGGAALTVMLSGYASGGQMGFPLVGALLGVLIASLAPAKPPDLEGALSIGVVGLFSLLVIGRFFGELSSSNAVLLFAAPLLSWLPELAPLGVGPRWRAAARVALAAAPVIVALILAQQQFVRDSARTAADSGDSVADDYMKYYGK